MLHRVTAHPEKPNGVNRHLNIAPDFLDAADRRHEARRLRVRFDGRGGRADRRRTPRPQKFATITADDAYRDNLTEALPVLEKHAAPFTIYVAPSLINGTADLWWELVEDIVAARDFVYVPTAEGQGARSTARRRAKKYAANVYLHDYLTQERARRRPARRRARSGAIGRRRFRAAAPRDADDLGRGPHGRRGIRWPRSARIRSTTTI